MSRTSRGLIALGSRPPYSSIALYSSDSPRKPTGSGRTGSGAPTVTSFGWPPEAARACTAGAGRPDPNRPTTDPIRPTSVMTTAARTTPAASRAGRRNDGPPERRGERTTRRADAEASEIHGATKFSRVPRIVRTGRTPKHGRCGEGGHLGLVSQISLFDDRCAARHVQVTGRGCALRAGSAMAWSRFIPTPTAKACMCAPARRPLHN